MAQPQIADARTARAAREARDLGYGDAARASRVAGERAPTYRTEAVHYRKDYETSMGDTQYKGAEDNRRAFDSAMSKARGQIATQQGALSKATSDLATARGSVDSGYSEGMDAISASRAQALSSANTGTTAINVYSKGAYEGTYQLPSSSVGSMSNDIHEYNAANDGDVDWRSDGAGGINLDVQGYGSDWHSQLSGAQALAAKQGQLNTQSINNQVSTATSQLGSQYSDAIGQIDQRQGDIDRANAEIQAATNRMNAYQTERTQSLNKIKIDYSNRLSRIKDTIMSMGNNGGKN